MTAKTAARRYATALFDVTRKTGSLDRAGRELAELSETIAGHAGLGRVFSSPAVPASVKQSVVTALIDASGDISGEVRRLLTMLAERDRLGLLADVASIFADRLLEEKQVVQAQVVTAAPLSGASRSAISNALGRMTGKTVTITERVDPAIVGGLVARVGGTVYDGSVTRQLERLRDALRNN